MSEMVRAESERPLDYRTQLDGILSQELTPENIDNYAENALNQLISFTETVTADYRTRPTLSFENQAHNENAAFDYFGLPVIEPILDHVGKKADEIAAIGHWVDAMEGAPDVLLPPNPDVATVIKSGNGGFEEKLLIPRTKVALFVLANEYGIDINDPSQLSLQSGIVTDKMMRQQSYVAVHVISRNRLILICDEEGNATFVFDTETAARMGMSPDNLARLEKPELKAFIEQQPELGKRIVYSKDFIPRLIHAIHDPSTDQAPTDEVLENAASSFLVPQAPEGYGTMKSMAELFGVSYQSLKETMHALGDTLGALGRFRFGSNTTWGYSPEQQELVRSHLAERGFMARAPEGYLTASGIAKALGGVYKATISAAIQELGENLGPVEQYMFASQRTNGFSPAQQNMILERLAAKGFFAEAAPEGHLSLNGIAKALGVSNDAVEKAVSQLGDTLGEVQNYKFVNKHALGFSPEQQARVREQLEANGLFVPEAPEGYASTFGIAKALGVDHITVSRAAKALTDELGEVVRHRHGVQRTASYSLLQQRRIRNYLADKGLTSPSEDT